MRWERLFEDLESQAAAIDEAELRSEVAERTRAELAQISLAQRFHASVGREVGLRLAGELSVSGRLAGWGRDWLLVAAGDEVLVPLAAILAVSRLQPQATAPAGIGVVASRVSLRSVLRAIARDRSAVAIRLTDGTQVVGTPDRVGADWLDLAVHDADEPPRAARVASRWAVPFRAVSAVRRREPRWG